MLKGIITCHTDENHLNLNLFQFQFILIINNIINRNNNCIDRRLGVNTPVILISTFMTQDIFTTITTGVTFIPATLQ